MNKVTIEVPSGLIDAGETVVESAIRELKEETGYVATLSSRSRSQSQSEKEAGDGAGFIMWNDPGFCNTNTKMIFVDVDMSDPRNQPGNLKTDLEDNEYIECFTIPLATLWDGLAELDRQGFAIDARVATLAQGMEMAKMWKHVVLS